MVRGFRIFLPLPFTRSVSSRPLLSVNSKSNIKTNQSVITSKSGIAFAWRLIGEASQLNMLADLTNYKYQEKTY